MVRLGFAATALCFMVLTAQAAGFQPIEIPGDGELPPLKGAVWYPCTRPASDTKVGPFVFSAATDCPVAGDKLPLIVISPGRAGTFLHHRDIAETLAQAGFVVAAINHPGDSALDKSRVDDISVFVERPADIKRTIDFMLGPWPDAAKIDAGRIGFFGFSRGGYTGLVAVGANPHFANRLRLCEGKNDPICDQVHKGVSPELAHDQRIKAVVIADPLGVYFTRQSFKGVNVPIQLWSSEHGGDGVTPESVAAIVDELPTKPDFHLVSGAQHFDFLAPCPDELVKSAPAICSDQTGFDRTAFHKELDAKALAFFRKHLVDLQQP